MTRQIKFRGKRLSDSKWNFGVPYHSEGTWWMLVDDNTRTQEIGTGSYQIIPETVGQYTGFKDKNGKEIFEGDIVKFLDIGEEGYEYKEGYDFNNIASIVWENGRFELDNIYDNNSAVLEFMNNESHEEFINELMHDCEIIGNIHDNAEFVKIGSEWKTANDK